MNLLRDAFFTVRLADGSEQQASVVDVVAPDVIDIVAPRPDFRGALYQFLIGVLQLAYAPSSMSDWKRQHKAPPDAATLQAALAKYESAFELQADGPAFMQDLQLPDTDFTPIAALLIESPGKKTITENLDHFVHRGQVNAICPGCAATALFTLQINAPAGGAGYRVSLRGGGPLTTLLLPAAPEAPLWQKLWLNVMPLAALDAGPVGALAAVLPWMGPTRTSDPKAGGVSTAPSDVHPLQAYWSMPRRIRLDFTNTHAGTCDLCGTHSPTLLTQYRTRNYGTDYSDQWLHPLTPYTLDPKQPPLSLKGRVAGGGYRYWAGLALGNEDGKPEAARVVRHANSTLSAMPMRLWCFGLDMDNAKSRCWYDAALPLHSVLPEHQRSLGAAVRALLGVADDAASLVNKQVKAAQFDRPKDVKSNPAVRQTFWQRTEPRFYAALEALARQDPGDPAVLATVYRQWLYAVERSALDVFDIWVQSVPIEHSNIRRVVEAQADLVKWLRAGKAVKPLWAVVKDNPKEAA